MSPRFVLWVLDAQSVWTALSIWIASLRVRCAQDAPRRNASGVAIPLKVPRRLQNTWEGGSSAWLCQVGPATLTLHGGGRFSRVTSFAPQRLPAAHPSRTPSSPCLRTNHTLQLPSLPPRLRYCQPGNSVSQPHPSAAIQAQERKTRLIPSRRSWNL